MGAEGGAGMKNPSTLKAQHNGGATDTTPETNPAEVRRFLETFTTLVKAATEGMTNPGLLQIGQVHPLDENSYVPTRYKLGDVERMIKDAIAFSDAGHNVYIESRTVRTGLRVKQRGKIEDTVAVFALVADDDGDKDEATEALPIEPTLLVESSPGNTHPWFFLTKAVPAQEGVAFGKALKAALGGDFDTGTLTQPFRVSGTINYPTQSKLERGRVAVPTKLLAATRAYSVEEFNAAFPPVEDDWHHDSATEFTADLGLIAAAVEAIPNNDLERGEWNTIGMAIWRASEGAEAGFKIFDKFSQKSTKCHNRGTAKKRWQHYFRSPPTRVGYGKLRYLATQADPDWERRLEEKLVQEIFHPPANPYWERRIFKFLQANNDNPIVANGFVPIALATEGARSEAVIEEPSAKPTDADVKPDPAPPDPAPPDANTDSDPVDLWNQFDAPELPTGLLPETIEKYARVEGDNMGCDPAGLAIAALTICAAAISDRIKLQVKEHDKHWTEAARIWTALVGDPSAKKSPILSQAVRPIAKIDNGLTCQYLAEKQRYDELSADQKKSNPPPKHPRAKIEDTTIEAAQEVLKDSPDGVLCLQDELSGFFGAMDKHSGKGAGADRAFWMKAYNGGLATYHRIARGSGLIPNLSVTMLGGIQPDAIRKVAADAIDDGLLQRMLFIVLRPAKVDQDKPRDPVVDNYNRLVDKLHRLLPPQEFGDDDMPLRFDRGAQAIRTQLAAKHIELMGSEFVNKKLATHVGKYDGVFARLCVLWHCIENVDQRTLPIEVTEDTARRVATFLHEFIFKHAVAFYVGVLGLADEHDRLRNVAGFILARKLDKITNRDIARGDRSMRRLTDWDTLKIFEQLEALGWVERRQKRVQVQRIVNPMVHVRFADRAQREAERRAEAREAVAKIFAK